MFDATEINAAIQAGQIVTARAADLPRKHQPRSGATVTLTQVWENDGGTIRATARGFQGRFRVIDVLVQGVEDVNGVEG